MSPAGDLDLVVGEEDGYFNYFANGYCTTSCGGRGVCDGTANLFPTCDCLTGFTGDQCDECQAGYFGSTCELCPEGGGETKAEYTFQYAKAADGSLKIVVHHSSLPYKK